MRARDRLARWQLLSLVDLRKSAQLRGTLHSHMAETMTRQRALSSRAGSIPRRFSLPVLPAQEDALNVGRVLRVIGGACPVLRTPLRGRPVFGEVCPTMAWKNLREC